MRARVAARRALASGASAVAATPQELGVDPQRYAQALRFLFDRPVPAYGAPAWYDDLELDAHDAVPFEASPLEWTRLQALLFANAHRDLAPYGDEQVGVGLRYLVDNGASDVPFAAIDPAVPKAEGLRMMRALPILWREVIAPRRGDARTAIGSGIDRLGSICYMWFDISPTFRRASADPDWRDAQWRLYVDLLAIPCRDVQVGALHGIGHDGAYLDRQPAIDRLVADFIRRLGDTDPELVAYAEAARVGRVQ